MSILKKKIRVTSDDIGLLTAEWLPIQPGMPTVGRGATVLEAIGSLVLYDQVVELEPTPLIYSKFSQLEPRAPERS